MIKKSEPREYFLSNFTKRILLNIFAPLLSFYFYVRNKIIIYSVRSIQ